MNYYEKELNIIKKSNRLRKKITQNNTPVIEYPPI